MLYKILFPTLEFIKMVRLRVLFFFILSILPSVAQVPAKLEMVETLLGSDPAEAERIIDSISLDDLKSCNDSIRLYYHYYAAAAIDHQGLTSEKKLNHLLSAKEIFETKLGIGYTLYFELMHAIGSEYEDLGNETEALLMYEEGLIKALPYLNDSDDGIQNNISILRSNLANLYRKHQYYDIANYFDDPQSLKDDENMLRNEMTNAVPGDYVWCVAAGLLANELLKQGNNEEANRVCEEAYPYTKALVEDPQTVHWSILQNLCDYQMVNKNYAKAIPYIIEMQSYLDKLGIDEFDVQRGWIYNKLGIVYMNDGHYDLSNESLIAAGEIIKKAYTEDSMEYATILHNMGRLAYLLNNFTKAKELLSKAVELQLKHTGKAMDRTSQYLKETNDALNK